ncbi:hypothetical protein AURDEDRAFT_174412 [Auricularia subglabra TFB-10046 SS5]|uniref:Ig-like domain-containing protein n=1 Tax=Auricularia subglabra (strain TFB-10046 / SS5) TaxID=717982 RepID=J0CYY1_AURST|nr:hypothetical protein AURDEDRAFT_174412 [Auricularia subglabra TFB-10046 SS5]
MRARSVWKKIRDCFSRSKTSPASTASAGNYQFNTEPAPIGPELTAEPEPDARTDTVGSHVDQAVLAHASAGRLGRTTAEVAEHAPHAWETVGSTVQLLKEASSGLKTLGRVLDGIGEVHPYVQAVTAVINGAIVKPIVGQDARDEAFEALLREMIRTFDLVKRELEPDAPGSKKPASYQRRLLSAISRESESCAGFIKDEYVAKKFWVRAAKNFLRGGDIDERIQQFRTAFADLRETWRDEKLIHLEAHAELDRLQRVTNAGHSSDNACLPGTRVEVLRELSDWIDSRDRKHALFLLGVAGCGKSSVAHSFFARCEENGVLGAFFSFDRAAIHHNACHAVSSLAYHLALRNQDYRDALVRILKSDSTLADSTRVSRLWQQLVVAPLRSIPATNTVLIAIDAIDECPDDSSRQSLLTQLTAHDPDLPANVCIFATSRAEPDVVRVLRDADTITSLDLADFIATSDIHLYVRARLPGPAERGLSDLQCARLADAADGLFQWAATMCAFLLDKPGGSSLHERFDRRIQLFMQGDVQSPRGTLSLNELYSHILSSGFDSDDPIAMGRYRSIVAMVLCASEGITLDDLLCIQRLAEPHETDVVKQVLDGLGALMEGVSGHTSIVRPMHTSFRDFLLDEGRSGIWYLSKDAMGYGHYLLALGMLRIMARDLTFNIAHVPSPFYFRNSLGTHENHHLLSELSPPLVYSSIWWVKHAPSAGDPGQIVTLRNVFREILFDKLLFFLELLAITSQPPLAGIEYHLSTAAWMFIVEPRDIEARMLIDDALLFFRYFRPAIETSLAHIYLSTLPFTPVRSLVRQRYIGRFSGLPSVSPILRTSWPLDVNKFLEMQVPPPLCMVCAPGMVLVTGNRAGKIKVFDLTIRSPPYWFPDLLLGESESPVLALVYSSKLHRIVSGHADGCIRFWDASIARHYMEIESYATLNGHRDAVSFLCLTPDDEHVVSASADGAICRSDVCAPTILQTIDAGRSHKLTGVTCSSDGLRIFSGSLDGIVRIWDLASGAAAGQLPCKLLSGVRHISHAPSGPRLAIVSAGTNPSVQIWDTERECLVGHLPGHISEIVSLAWAPDGRYLASSSHEGKESVRVWDTSAMLPVGTLPHSGAISIAFSPEGDKLYTCASDIRAWYNPAYDRSQYLTAPKCELKVVAYSADGRFLRAEDLGAESRCWLVETGTPVDSPPGTAWRSSSTESADGRFKLTRAPNGDFIVHDQQAETPLEPLLTLRGTDYNCCDIAPDGSFLAAGSVRDLVDCSDDGTFWDEDDPRNGSGVRLWELKSGYTDMATYCYKSVRHLVFSPDSKEIAVCLDDDGTVATWPVECYAGDRRRSNLRFLTINFRHEATVDPDTRVPYADAHLRGTRPFIKVPKEYAAMQLTAGMRRLFHPRPLVIDFANTHHGTEWTKCFSP